MPRKALYPFDTIQPGEEFVVPAAFNPGDAALRTRAHYWSRRRPGVKFKVANERDGSCVVACETARAEPVFEVRRRTSTSTAASGGVPEREPWS